MKLRLGLIINPWAGLGGAVALKGSDGEEIRREALARGAKPQVQARAQQAFERLTNLQSQLEIWTCPGDMGATLCSALGMIFHTLPLDLEGRDSRPEDTRHAAALLNGKVDLLVFVGGDGTARDVCANITSDQLCLGIPAGVKMHSGVFAVTPVAAGEIIRMLLDGKLVAVQDAEVRDIDEAAYRGGKIRASHFGDMRVPAEGRYLQQVKCGGREDESLVRLEIAAFLVEHMEPAVTYFVGAGTTTLAVTEALGLPGTLLGVDVVRDGELLQADATETQLYAFASEGPCRIILSLTGGQGALLGRGNQQFSPRVLRAVGLQHLQPIAAKSKLEVLQGRPLLVDTGDSSVNQGLSGYRRILTGYDDWVVYPVAFHG